MRGAALALVLLALAVGCGGTTGGHLLQVPFEAGGIARDASQPFTFVTEQGWTVTLTQAEVVLGPLYFNVIASQTVGFRSGVVIMQVTQQFIVNMLNPTLVAVPNGADGESGTAVSVEVGFFTAVNGYNNTIQLPAPLAEEGQQGTAFLAGQAIKAGVIVAFAGRVQITNALVTGLDPIDYLARVAGALCNLTFTPTSGPLELRVNPSRWFDQANFCDLVVAPPAGVAASDGSVADASWTDGGTTDGAPSDGGSDGSVPVRGLCSPTAGTVYGWADTNPVNSAVIGGMQGTVGVYDFSLGP
jgi:hypothetical protein